MMNGIETLLEEYIAEHARGGRADPVAYLSRAAPEDRRELALLIDGFLARAPRAPLAHQTSSDPRAEATIDELSRSIGGAAGLWPSLLPRLRDRAGLKRRDLVERLAGSLGVGDRVPKVERYYHEMELGLLPAGGVSDRVLEALGKLVGATATELRDAGATLGGGLGAGTTQAEAFARTASVAELAIPARASGATEPDDQWDEVDELFRGSA
jgi:hypothetical protein